jgi:hypothetical protein
MTLCGDNWLYAEASLKKSGSSYRLSKPEGFEVSLYVVVNIANEDKKLQTPADIISVYARKI